MPTPPISNDLLLETLAAFEQNNRNYTFTGRELGINESSVRRRVHTAHMRGLHLSDGGREAMVATRLNGVEIAGGYRHVYDEDGKKVETVRWNAPKAETSAEDIADRVRAAFESLTPARTIPAPEYVNSDLCTVYCLADMHIGQLSWAREVGAAYDVDIATSRLRDWVGRLVAASPASKKAVILDVGDTTHQDDTTNATRKSKHVLDVDGRFLRTIEETVEALSDAIELALAKHEEVTVVILEGNHSPHSYIPIMIGLSERFRLNPRVTVRKGPGAFWADEFGKNMLAAAHGDKAKPERMVMFMADEHSEIWGRTRHRFLWTGHFHSTKMQDIGGVKHEQLRAMTSRDAYAYSSAYVARSQLQAITLHAETGELQRSYVGL